MNNISFRFQNPWALLLIIPAAGLIYLIRRRMGGEDAKSAKSRILMALRLAAAVFLVLVLSGATLISDLARPSLVILLDRSDSVTRAAVSPEEGSGEKPEAASAPRETWEALRACLPDGMETAILSFGGDTSLDRPLAKGIPDEALPAAAIDSSATDVEQALLAAAALFPPDSQKRLILLSDGAFTDGDGLSAARQLYGQGIRLDALLVEGEEMRDEAAVTSVVLPGDVSLGSSMPLAVTVMSTGAMAATLEVSDESGHLSSRQVRLFPGENRFNLTASPRSGGLSAFYVTVSAERDTLSENNTAGAICQVTTGENVLIASGGTEASALWLSGLLSEQGISSDIVLPEDIPESMPELCAYSMVILQDVDALALSPKAAERLRDYVSVYGRTLAASGGSHAFIFGNMKDTPVEEALPVSMEVEKTESEEPAALMILMDNSASMEGTAIVMAKRGAIRCIEALNANDYVGVITFSTEHSILSPISGMEKREEIISEVASLGTVMGTAYTGALLAAEEELSAFTGADKKHIILLSDGNPSDSGYEEIIARMAKRGISVSAIALGKDVSEEVMSRIASLGNGRCYMVESSYDLPAIMLTDTVLTQVEYAASEPVRVRSSDPRLRLPEGLPLLKGYTRFQEKPGAEVVLKAENGDPLFVRGRYGSGQGAAFAWELSGENEWQDSREARNMLGGLFKELLPDSHAVAAEKAALTDGGTKSLLTVWCASAEDETVIADISYPAGEGGGEESAARALLTRTEEGVWESSIPYKGPGRVDMTITRQGPSGEILETFETSAVSGWSREYDAFTDHIGRREALQSLAGAGGGLLSDTPERLFEEEMESIPIERDLGHPLALLAFAAIFLELAIRKLRVIF